MDADDAVIFLPARAVFGRDLIGPDLIVGRPWDAAASIIAAHLCNLCMGADAHQQQNTDRQYPPHATLPDKPAAQA